MLSAANTVGPTEVFPCSFQVTIVPVMVRFALDDFLRGNALERAQVYEILNRIGAMSVEQIQREEDLIPNEG